MFTNSIIYSSGYSIYFVGDIDLCQPLDYNSSICTCSLYISLYMLPKLFIRCINNKRAALIPSLCSEGYFQAVVIKPSSSILFVVFIEVEGQGQTENDNKTLG